MIVLGLRQLDHLMPISESLPESGALGLMLISGMICLEDGALGQTLISRMIRLEDRALGQALISGIIDSALFLYSVV